MAVGATTHRVHRMILLQGLKLSAVGIIASLILAEILVSAVPELVAPADPVDPLIYSAMAAILLAATLVSSCFPARRAARIDPNECLRCE